jgi:DNA polymerase III delta prime subunit
MKKDIGKYTPAQLELAEKLESILQEQAEYDMQAAISACYNSANGTNTSNSKYQQLKDALSALIYSAEQNVNLIISVTDRVDLENAIESAKETLKRL